jgi:hypothetical protein
MNEVLAMQKLQWSERADEVAQSDERTSSLSEACSAMSLILCSYCETCTTPDQAE